jgi:hypothetical protein
MNKIYSCTIYKYRGRLPKSSSENPCWEKDKIRENSGLGTGIKHLGSIPGWIKGISGKTPACKQEH